MQIEIGSASSVFNTNIAATGTQKSPRAATSPQQDKWEVSIDYQQYMSTSGTGNSASQARIKALAEQLRQDTSFSQYKRRNFINHPVGRELATELIWVDEGLQEKIAKQMWETLSWTAHRRELPASWRDINVKAMLLSSDELAQNSVGIYCRLSNDDERDGESVSIENQEDICQGYFHPKNAMFPFP